MPSLPGGLAGASWPKTLPSSGLAEVGPETFLSSGRIVATQVQLSRGSAGVLKANLGASSLDPYRMEPQHFDLVRLQDVDCDAIL